ncbi:hypothetical protein SH2C18_36920 [Clostridium sediminicola]|uniref:sigma-70 family RNA polymerase sigma factor n=1 Tax=Clostridium sediminicola TaxID=3114879 RepID=UPI0031F225C0
MGNLLIKAKNNDSQSIQKIINKYMPLLISESLKYEIPGYDFEDIVQHNILSIIKSIKLYKLGSNSFDSFLEVNLKLNNMNLFKRKMKHNREIQNVNILESVEDNYLFTIEEQGIAYELTKRIRKNINCNKIISKTETKCLTITSRL